MSRNYKYVILIRFSCKSTSLIGNFQVSYPYSNDHNLKDNILIRENSVIITAYRSKKTSIYDLIHKTNTAMNSQITKALAYYYACMGEANKITSIKATRKLNDLEQEKETIYKAEIRQIINSDNDFPHLKQINRTQLKSIFEETEAGKSLLFAVTHLISSCSNVEPFQNFESLWKCFNSIYKIKEGSNQDKTCLESLRAHMVANISMYPLSTNQVSQMTYKDIFSIINWRSMILNDFKNESQTEHFKGFIKRISDARLIKMVDITLSIREEYLDKKGFLQEVKNHIALALAQSKNSDIEVVAFMCLRYLYFARNKIFHAERVHPNFYWAKALTNDEIKITKCNTILTMLIIDLLNFNTNF